MPSGILGLVTAVRRVATGRTISIGWYQNRSSGAQVFEIFLSHQSFCPLTRCERACTTATGCTENLRFDSVRADDGSTERLVRQKNVTATAILDGIRLPALSPFLISHLLTSCCIDRALQRGRNTCRRFATLCAGVRPLPRTRVRGYCISSRCDWQHWLDQLAARWIVQCSGL
ncbi:hypothetical protein Rcae01_01062 [Novipirellula caenicola]|uniref:Uncharacterized protein n=1 Tax=Novipirellula caenicola TaxID=1536901 RepID=A0ABP9VK93_9BACT